MTISKLISWVAEFLHAGGLNSLLVILDDLIHREEIHTQHDGEILGKTILCMKGPILG